MKRTVVSFTSVLVGFVVSTLAAGAPARAWVPRTQTFAAVKASRPPAMDPSLSDPIWKTGLTMTDFYDFTTRQPAAHATTVYVLYDAKNLYVGIRAEQAGVPITATQTVDHAGTQTDDHIGLDLDTAGNGSRVYQFRANPKGVHDEYSSENARYAPDWTSLSKIYPNGDYNLLYVIPLAVIRGASTPVQNWRINVVRFIAATNDEYTWAYDSAVNDVGIQSSRSWPFMTGLQIPPTATRPRPRADVFALGSAGSDHRQFQNGIGNFVDTKPRGAGIDVTYPFTNTLAFVGTANPDFSNVEQDQTTIAPQEFQKQYNEYRPFFAQGANFINSIPGINLNSFQTLFYTPSIGIFNHGEKIEGTIGKNSIGILNAGGNGFDDAAFGYSYGTTDNAFTLSLEGVDANHVGLKDTATGYGAAFLNQHSGALVITSYETDRGTNITAPSQANDVQLGGGVINSHGKALFAYQDVGPQFDPIDGYTQINDIRGPAGFLELDGSGHKGGFVKSYSLIFGADRYLDRSGAVREADMDETAKVLFANQFSINVGSSIGSLRFYQQPYPFYVGGVTQPFDQQNVGIGYKDGSPTPTDVMYMWGPFGNVYLQQMSSSTVFQRGANGLSLEFDGTVEKRAAWSLPGTPGLDSQWLRRVSFTHSFTKNASLAIGVRSINGIGGFAPPGTNLAIAYHQRFANLDELYIDYGTPAASQTLHRWIVKYVFHFGGAPGT